MSKKPNERALQGLDTYIMSKKPKKPVTRRKGTATTQQPSENTIPLGQEIAMAVDNFCQRIERDIQEDLACAYYAMKFNMELNASITQLNDEEFNQIDALSLREKHGIDPDSLPGKQILRLKTLPKEERETSAQDARDKFNNFDKSSPDLFVECLNRYYVETGLKNAIKRINNQEYTTSSDRNEIENTLYNIYLVKHLYKETKYLCEGTDTLKINNETSQINNAITTLSGLMREQGRSNEEIKDVASRAQATLSIEEPSKLSKPPTTQHRNHTTSLKEGLVGRPGETTPTPPVTPLSNSPHVIPKKAKNQTKGSKKIERSSKKSNQRK